MKKKQLSLILFVALLTYNLSSPNVYAITTEQPTTNKTVCNLDSTYEGPIVGLQTLYFNTKEPQDVTITGVDFKKEDLRNFALEQTYLPLDKLIIDKAEKTITIPAEVLSSLNLDTKLYAVAIEFTDYTYYLAYANIMYTNDKTVTPPTPDDNHKPTYNPSISQKIVSYDIAKPDDIIINNVDFDNDILNKIYINNSVLDKNDFTITNNSIIISKESLKNATLVEGNYSISFTFKSGKVLKSAVELEVINSTSSKDEVPVLPPANDVPVLPPADDVPVNITFDTNKDNTLKVSNIIPSGSTISSIFINDMEVTVKDTNLILLKTTIYSDFEPYVYIDGENLIIPKETLLALKIDNSNYDINIILDNGEVINKTLAIDFVDSSKDSTIITPDKSEDTNTPNSSDSNIFTEKPSNNSTIVKTNKNYISNTPKTGDTSSIGFIASLLAATTALGFTRKKHK
ncbi:LPXTG cell wall anchor domain-containing protein [Clostridium bornimense]|uniref:LPXTG cell wall anchor domain-containing protein n=1 Tax=Clostridium bornimense TaxID=1216932 RepID=UPI001C100490|nr:LPXTG cell wall anchor domain-containing protein [Clostridium bornimense]MBU5316530.1 LPXTG cell wall anchor domain-containing protein [Clostridium bornimense]